MDENGSQRKVSRYLGQDHIDSSYYNDSEQVTNTFVSENFLLSES